MFEGESKHRFHAPNGDADRNGFSQAIPIYVTVFASYSPFTLTTSNTASGGSQTGQKEEQVMEIREAQATLAELDVLPTRAPVRMPIGIAQAGVKARNGRVVRRKFGELDEAAAAHAKNLAAIGQKAQAAHGVGQGHMLDYEGLLTRREKDAIAQEEVDEIDEELSDERNGRVCKETRRVRVVQLGWTTQVRTRTVRVRADQAEVTTAPKPEPVPAPAPMVVVEKLVELKPTVARATKAETRKCECCKADFIPPSTAPYAKRCRNCPYERNHRRRPVPPREPKKPEVPATIQRRIGDALRIHQRFPRYPKPPLPNWFVVKKMSRGHATVYWEGKTFHVAL